MLSIEEREKNLFNATDTLAQFYDEIETFLAILFGHMKRAGYTSKGDRLRSGTSGIRNLTRRLLATAIVVYVKGGGSEDTLDDEEEQDDEDQDAGKGGKAEILISAATRVPFVQIFLFAPKAIPNAKTLSSPTLYYGALGNLAFVDKKRRCCTARSKSLTSLCRLQSHPAQYVSGIPSAAILLSISHPIRCSTRCLANVRARISGPMSAL